jgi:predicted HAD superfamily Cof-like phosphohydrolase
LGGAVNAKFKEADIVERLRAGTNGVDSWCESVSEMVGYWHPLADEAADEIERLREEVMQLRSDRLRDG